MNENMERGSLASQTATYRDRRAYPEPIPESMPEQDKIREINIQEVNRGYIVRVGCHTFVLETADGLINYLTQYVKNPQATEKLWFNKKLF